MTKILLFIPMYNCEKQITRVLGQLTDNICDYLSEVLIINNRSTDNGEAAVMNYLSGHAFPVKISVLRNDDNYGLGGSHKVAFEYAIDKNFDYVKEAIRLGIDDYLLKSDMDEELFATKILKIREKIEREQQKKQYTESMIFKELFLKNVEEKEK